MQEPRQQRSPPGLHDSPCFTQLWLFSQDEEELSALELSWVELVESKLSSVEEDVFSAVLLEEESSRDEVLKDDEDASLLLESIVELESLLDTVVEEEKLLVISKEEVCVSDSLDESTVILELSSSVVELKLELVTPVASPPASPVSGSGVVENSPVVSVAGFVAMPKVGSLQRLTGYRKPSSIQESLHPGKRLAAIATSRSPSVTVKRLSFA